jgi:hypothetical protein
MSPVPSDSLNPDNLTKMIAMATAAVALIGAVATLINNFIKEGILFNRKKLKDSEQIVYVKEMLYLDENAKNNYKNSIVFRALTGKQTPIHKVNLILNCYDPYLATYIYSKAANYIQFNNNQLSEPKLVRSKSIKFSIYILIALSFSMMLLGFLGLNGLGSYHPNPSINANILNAIRMLINIFFVFFMVAILLGLWGFNYSLNELSFLSKVRKFYDDYRLWKADQDKDQQIN